MAQPFLGVCCEMSLHSGIPPSVIARNMGANDALVMAAWIKLKNTPEGELSEQGVSEEQSMDELRGFFAAYDGKQQATAS